MEKNVLNENKEKIIDETKDYEFRNMLMEGFKDGTYMTADVFCQRLEKLKISLINRYNLKNGGSNSG